MLEGYEISYHPVDNDDPDDPQSEAFQDELYDQATGRTGWPGAIDVLYLYQTDNRAHLVIVQQGIDEKETGRLKVVRILRAPLEGDLPSGVWQDAMIEVMREMSVRYPRPGHNMAFGGSCLSDAMRAFPIYTNNDQVPIEQIVLTPKQPSVSSMPGAINLMREAECPSFSKFYEIEN